MSNHFIEWIWVKACNAWAEVSNWIGFESVKIAYIQGYYAGYKQALRDQEKEDQEKEDDSISTQEQ